MCRSPSTGGTGQTRPGGYVARRGMAGNHRPKSRGRDRRPRGERRGLARSLRRSPSEQAQATGKWRDNIRRGGARARQRGQPETRNFPAGSRHHELAEAVITRDNTGKAARERQRATVSPSVLKRDASGPVSARSPGRIRRTERERCFRRPGVRCPILSVHPGSNHVAVWSR